MIEQHTRPSAWRLFLTWATIGLQSFGGGASTLLLVQQAFIERTGWVSKEEYLRLWSLCQITPGITLIAFTALIGQKLGGARGVVISLAGMLLPSSAITCLLAALFLQVDRSTTTQAALRGIIPATGGIMILVLYNFAQPLIGKTRQMGMLASLGSAALTLLCAALVIVFNVSAIVIIVGLALLGAVVFAPRQRPGDTPADLPAEETPR
jgi:chromate transporter